MDASSQASKTALMVCAYRARATARPQPICRDPWAAALAGDEGARLAAAFDARFPHMELWLALRVAYLDAQVVYWTAHGVNQVVILGAGFDTRAARLARTGVQFFEVDHPATQADKRARLARHVSYPIDAPRYVAVDFEAPARGDFVDALVRAGFDLAQPALILWEGVVPYLTEAAVRATARRVAHDLHPSSILIFDFVGKRMVEGLAGRAQDRQTAEYVAALGEPIRFGTNDILPLLAAEGFRQVRVQSFDELALAATGTYDRAREFRFQSVCLCSAAPWRASP